MAKTKSSNSTTNPGSPLQTGRTCTDFVASIPDEKQRSLTHVHLYPAATHGWDHGKTYSFFARTACKGSGCNNTNESSPEITQAAKADLLKFLQQKLGL